MRSWNNIISIYLTVFIWGCTIWKCHLCMQRTPNTSNFILFNVIYSSQHIILMTALQSEIYYTHLTDKMIGSESLRDISKPCHQVYFSRDMPWISSPTLSSCVITCLLHETRLSHSQGQNPSLFKLNKFIDFESVLSFIGHICTAQKKFTIIPWIYSFESIVFKTFLLLISSVKTFT